MSKAQDKPTKVKEEKVLDQRHQPYGILGVKISKDEGLNLLRPINANMIDTIVIGESKFIGIVIKDSISMEELDSIVNILEVQLMRKLDDNYLKSKLYFL